MGGLRPFGYAHANPNRYVDPDGLQVESTASGMGVHVQRGSASTQREAGRPGNAEIQQNLHPAVQAALPPQPLERWDTANCAEPRAVSDYLDRTVGRDASPAQVREALKNMKLGSRNETGGEARAPCMNCSQFLGNLMATYGAPSPSNIGKGTTTRGDGPTNFTPPPEGAPGFQSYSEALAAYPGRPPRG
jgi:hypothetical protein